MFKATLLGTVFSGVIMMTNPASAGDSSSHDGPPKTYQLADVHISVLHQTGHRLPGSYRIEIQGNGTASQSVDQQSAATTIVSTDKLIELLNEFYRIHFFELQNTYGFKKQVALLDDQSITTSAYRLVDVSSHRLCLVLGDYKKCVTIVDQKPLDASRLVQKIEALFTSSNSDP